MLEAATPDADNFTAIVGTKVVQLQLGRADLFIGINPSFSRVDPTLARTALFRQPQIILRGLDAESLESISSQPLMVSFENGKNVCPEGYILQLGDPTADDGRRTGTCFLCNKGTYSISPLAGPKDPACYPCPAGGTCNGGADVNFSIGTWRAVDGIYYLQSCPPGHALVNSDSLGGGFNQKLQECVACALDQYILNTSSGAGCQQCPIGGSCDGTQMSSLVAGAVWTANTGAGVYVLTACPPGYELLNRDANGEVAYNLQQCAKCPPGYFCIGGQVGRASCPAGTFALSGATSQDYCKPSVDVAVTVKLSISQADFTAPLQDRFREALADAAGVVPDQVLLAQVVQTTRRGAAYVDLAEIYVKGLLRTGIGENRSEFFSSESGKEDVALEAGITTHSEHHEAIAQQQQADIAADLIGSAWSIRHDSGEGGKTKRRQAGNKVLVSCTISAPSTDTASTIISTLNQEKLNDQLLRQGLPAGSLMSAAVEVPNSGQGSSVPWTLVGSLVGVGALVAVFGGLWAMGGKEESEEDRELRLAVTALRARLKIRAEDGYLISSEQLSVVSLRVIRCIIPKPHAEAAARLSLGHHFDVQQFDAFCMTIKESLAAAPQSLSFRRSFSSTPQYVALCDWLMEVSALLIRVEVDEDGVMQTFKSLSGEERIQFFVHEVTARKSPAPRVSTLTR